MFRGKSRNSLRRFPMVVDPKCRGLGEQPPSTDKVLVFKNVKFYVDILNWTIPGLSNTVKNGCK